MDKCSIMPDEQKRLSDPRIVIVSVISRTRFKRSSAEEWSLEQLERKQARQARGLF